MDHKKTKKIQNTRIVMTNIFMGISVIAIVFILMLIAMGFSFNSQGGLEQSGLLQITSQPSGATVEIDGETQFSRTEISKMLSSGEHKVKITKSGYNTWETNIRVDAGLLTHINWVRLFPLNPITEEVATYKQARLLSYSNDRKYLLYSEQGSDTLELINLQGDNIKTTSIKLSDILDTKNTEVISSAILSAVDWNDSNRKILLNWTHESQTDWIIADLDHPEQSVNLSTKFGFNFDRILISNSSASKLWATENGNLHLIDLSNSTISEAKITGIQSIANNKDVVAFLRNSTVLSDENIETQKVSLDIFKEGESDATTIADLTNKNFNNFTISLGTYWSEEWIAYSTDSNLVVLAGKYPSYDRPSKNSLKVVLSREVDHSPTSISQSNEQRIVAYRSTNKIVSFDFETKDYYDIALNSETSTNWLDEYIIWQHEDKKTTIVDFNGGNYRELIANTNNQLPICLTDNDRWLYYFDVKEIESVTDENPDSNLTNEASVEPTVQYTLIREKLNI